MDKMAGNNYLNRVLAMQEDPKDNDSVEERDDIDDEHEEYKSKEQGREASIDQTIKSDI
jgi:hypothetical protein